jgi:hypothetical protein
VSAPTCCVCGKSTYPDLHGDKCPTHWYRWQELQTAEFMSPAEALWRMEDEWAAEVLAAVVIDKWVSYRDECIRAFEDFDWDSGYAGEEASRVTQELALRAVRAEARVAEFECRSRRVFESTRHWIFSAWRANLRTLQDQLARQKQRHHRLRQVCSKRLWAQTCKIRILEAENARLRAAALPIANLVEDAERDEAELIEDESTPNGLWASLVGVMDESDHYHELIQALGAFRDAFLGEQERCEKCGSALLGDHWEEQDDGSRKWWRGCYHCGPAGCPDVTEEYE